MKYGKKYFIVLSLVVISAMMFVACQPKDPWEGIGTEENPILFAAVPSGETERVLSGFEDMADLIFESTGLVIKPFVATSYAGVIAAMCQDEPKAHMAALATFSYVLASEKGCAEVALVSTRYGSAFYNGQFVVLADSDFETLEDLKGASWCVSEKLSTSGVIIPSIMFAGLGIDITTDMGEMVEAGTHEAAAAGVYNGDCDFATTYVDARSRIEEDYPDIMEMTKVIAVEPDIPNDGIQFVTGFPEDVKATLVKGILALFETDEGLAAMDAAYQWSGLVEKDNDFYEPFRQILDASGIDIEDLAKN